MILFLPRKAERQKCHTQRHRLPLGIVGIAIIQAEVSQPAIGHGDILLILHQPDHKQAAGQQVHHKVEPMDITKNMGRQIDQRHKQRLCFVPLPDAGQQAILQLCIRHPFLIHHAVRANGRVPQACQYRHHQHRQRQAEIKALLVVFLRPQVLAIGGNAHRNRKSPQINQHRSSPFFITQRGCFSFRPEYRLDKRVLCPSSGSLP